MKFPRRVGRREIVEKGVVDTDRAITGWLRNRGQLGRYKLNGFRKEESTPATNAAFVALFCAAMVATPKS